MCGLTSRCQPKQLTATHEGRFVMANQDRTEYYKQYRQRRKNDDPEYLTKDRARVSKYRQDNPDKEKARSKKYRQLHKNDKEYNNRMRAARIRWSRSPRGLEKARARNERYRQSHPGKETSRQAHRRAIELGAKSEKISRQEIYERDGGKCHLCGKKCNPSKWHLDHIIPLSLGGEHTKQNVAVACPRCNESKGNRGHSQLRLFG